MALLTGCGQIRSTLPSRLPSIERVVDIAKESAMQAETWVPLTAAAVIGVTGADESISDWASNHKPVFGSEAKARRASDDLRNALVAGMALSSVFAPTPTADNAFPTRRVVTNVLASGAVAGVVEVGKRTIKRQRPNGLDDRSFPSGHTSIALFLSEPD